MSQRCLLPLLQQDIRKVALGGCWLENKNIFKETSTIGDINLKLWQFLLIPTSKDEVYSGLEWIWCIAVLLKFLQPPKLCGLYMRQVQL